MTQEEKQELIIALCGYLPYKCKGKYEIVRILESETKIERFDGELDSNVLDYDFEYENFKPYLRPMSSMTEEEGREVRILWNEDFVDKISIYHCYPKTTNFYNKHHLDYRGLIEKGLALEAPEGMYNIKAKE